MSVRVHLSLVLRAFSRRYHCDATIHCFGSVLFDDMAETVQIVRRAFRCRMLVVFGFQILFKSRSLLSQTSLIEMQGEIGCRIWKRDRRI